ncbi:hypothetical protein PA05_1853 [Cutibacterium acnes P05]|nr:hypothetical protein [Cutibacterium acnes P05]
MPSARWQDSAASTYDRSGRPLKVPIGGIVPVANVTELVAAT